MKKLALLIASLLMLAACTTPAVPVPTAIQSIYTPSITPSPTQTPSPTFTPTPTIALPVGYGTPIPALLESINPQTLPLLTLLAQRPTDGYALRNLVVSPDSRLLAVYIGNKSINITQMDNGMEVWSQDFDAVVPPQAISFSSDGKWIQIVCDIYNTSDFSLVHQFTRGPYLKDSCNSLTFFPDGTKVIAGTLAKAYEAHIWNIDGTQDLQTITLFVDGESIPGQQYTLSPDGSLLLTHEWISVWAKNLWLFQISDNKVIKKFEYGSQDKFGIWDLHWGFSPDGTLLAIDITRANMYAELLYLADMPHTLEIWRLSDMTRIQQLDGLGELCGLAFSPAGDMVAERSYDQITFRNTVDWNIISQFEISGCTPVVFSPDGKLLVTGAQQGIDSSTVLIYGVMP